jgi:quercetin dioxygenase-like cupin family protein
MQQTWFARGLAALALFAGGYATGLRAHAPVPDDSPQRVEQQRTELTGAPGMEVVASIAEYHKGEGIARHVHHGVEAAYVVQGTMVQVPGKDPMPLPTGRSIVNLRDVAHAGFTVVGDEPLKLYTVHVVDKGKPLYDYVP